MDSTCYLNNAPLFAQTTFNAGDGYMQEYFTQNNKLQSINYKTMHKVLPCVVKLRRYSLVKKMHRFFSKSLPHQVFGLPSLQSCDKIYTI